MRSLSVEEIGKVVGGMRANGSTFRQATPANAPVCFNQQQAQTVVQWAKTFGKYEGPVVAAAAVTFAMDGLGLADIVATSTSNAVGISAASAFSATAISDYVQYANTQMAQSGVSAYNTLVNVFDYGMNMAASANAGVPLSWANANYQNACWESDEYLFGT